MVNQLRGPHKHRDAREFATVLQRWRVDSVPVWWAVCMCSGPRVRACAGIFSGGARDRARGGGGVRRAGGPPTSYGFGRSGFFGQMGIRVASGLWVVEFFAGKRHGWIKISACVMRRLRQVLRSGYGAGVGPCRTVGGF